MSDILIIPETQQLPEPFCPETWQETLDGFAENMRVRLPEGSVSFVKGTSPPQNMEAGTVWIKTDENNQILGFFTVVEGVWVEAKRQGIYYTDVGPINSLLIQTGEGIKSIVEVTGRPFIVNIAVENNGPVKMAIDGSPSVPLYKEKNVELRSGDLKSGQLALIASDGANFQLITTIPQSRKRAIHNTEQPNVPNAGDYFAWSHGFQAPPVAQVYMKAIAGGQTESGYVDGDMVSIEAFIAESEDDGASPVGAFHVIVTATQVLVRRVARTAETTLDTGIIRTINVQPKSGEQLLAPFDAAKWSVVVYAEEFSLV